MFQRITAVALIALLLLTPLTATATPAKEARHTEKIKAGIAKLGLGTDARVKLKLKDNSKLSGYISAIGDETFVITDVKTETPITVAYPNVAQVQGNNLSTRTKIIIGVSVVVAIIIVLYNVRGAFCDGCD